MGERGPVGPRGFLVSKDTSLSVLNFSFAVVDLQYIILQGIPGPSGSTGEKGIPGNPVSIINNNT